MTRSRRVPVALLLAWSLVPVALAGCGGSSHFKNNPRPPETLQGTARDLIRGAYKLSDRLLLLLDTNKALRTGVQE